MILGVWSFLGSFIVQSFSIVIVIGLIGLLIGKRLSYRGEEDDL